MGDVKKVWDEIEGVGRRVGREVKRGARSYVSNVRELGREVDDVRNDVYTVIGDIATGGSITQSKLAKQSMREGERLSAQALAAQQNQARLAAQEQNRANQRRPDIAAILARAQAAGRGGAASTSLTGLGGVPKRNLKLGETSLLGE